MGRKANVTGEASTMRHITIAAVFAACSVMPAFAQTTTATGVGVGIAKSTSVSGAVAISGQGGAGGNSNVTVNGTPAVSTVNTVASGTQTLRNVPTVFAPGLAAAGLETCLGSVSAGVGVIGTGVSFGTSIPDTRCSARLDARTLWSMGLKKAAVARLCLNDEIYRSMPEVCAQYLPQPYPYAVAAVEPVPVPRNTYLTTGVEPILLIDGKTGRERLCNNYDEPGQKCRAWAYATESHRPPKRKVATNKSAPMPLPKVITDPPPASPKAAEGSMGF